VRRTEIDRAAGEIARRRIGKPGQIAAACPAAAVAAARDRSAARRRKKNRRPRQPPHAPILQVCCAPEEATMKIGVLGTGMVGTTIASKLVSLGHEVKLGSRTAHNEKAASWAKSTHASHGTFADAAAFGELVFNCTSGQASLAALREAGAANLRGKVLVDVANPLDFSKGMPPTLFTGNNDSLGEQIQREFPDAKVVKALNTINAGIMVQPHKIGGGDHVTFVGGNDASAKKIVSGILTAFGWQQIVDLGDITAARGTESYLNLWLRLYGALGTADFNIKIVR
jgi:predicted dinucleotide-binding enzyme